MVRNSDLILVIIAFLCPPIATGMLTGCSCDLLINIALTLLGYFPGHIHAFWLIYKRVQAEERYGERGFIYIDGEYQPLDQAPAGSHQHYGATEA